MRIFASSDLVVHSTDDSADEFEGHAPLIGDLVHKFIACHQRVAYKSVMETSFQIFSKNCTKTMLNANNTIIIHLCFGTLHKILVKVRKK